MSQADLDSYELSLKVYLDLKAVTDTAFMDGEAIGKLEGKLEGKVEGKLEAARKCCKTVFQKTKYSSTSTLVWITFAKRGWLNF